MLIHTNKAKKDLPRFFFFSIEKIFKQLTILMTAEESILFSSDGSQEPN